MEKHGSGCPVCGTDIRHPTCETCGTDLSDLVAATRAARQQWRRARENFQAGRVSEALSQARLAATLALGTADRELLGWLLFLTGDVRAAAHTWAEIPPPATQIAVAFNQALDAAQGGDLDTARRLIAPFELPMPQVASLRGALGLWNAGTLPGDSTDAAPSAPDVRRRRSTRPDAIQSWPRRATAALILLGAGLGTGYLLFAVDEPDQQLESATEPERVAVTPPPDTAGEAASLRDAGRAFLEPGELLLTSVTGERGISAEPDSLVAWIPASARMRASRVWYGSALAAKRTGDSDAAIGAFTSSLMAVGAASDAYWTDDALYALVTAETLNLPERRKHAEFISRLHSGSMFDNSVVKSLLGSNEDEL